jgi:N-acetylmuramoyl-L-alanine amidase
MLITSIKASIKPVTFEEAKGKKLIASFGYWPAIMATMIAVCLLHFTALADNDGKVNKVVIDAGHGGRDGGAPGYKIPEKVVTLAVALKTGEYIKKNYPDVEVIYTRTKDEFVELYKRAEIANKHHADLFISIHCNSNKSRIPFGTETFVMGLHKSNANLEVAKLENAAMLLEDDYEARYEGYDPNSPESHIIFSLYQNVYREKSLSFASLIQEQFTEKTKLFNRGVKEAGFLVLYKTAMPGVLVEAGFLSNPDEEKFITSEKGQNLIASSIFRAFRQYKHNVERTPIPSIRYNEDSADRLSPSDTFLAASKTQTEPKPVLAKKEGKKPEPAKSEPAKTINPTTESGISATTKTEQPKPQPSQTQLVFRVQVALSNHALKPNDPKLKGLQNIFEYVHQKQYKYCAGQFSTEEEAIKYRDQVRKTGYTDAFVVAFKGAVRIPIEEARQIK